MRFHPEIKAVSVGQWVEIDGQAYEVVDIDHDHGVYLVNVADARGQSLGLGHFQIPFAEAREIVLH